VREAASRAFTWIGSVAVEVDGGLAWLERGVLVDDLYAGSAGVLFGCAEAAATGLETGRVSIGARDRLLHLANSAGHHRAATMPDDGVFSGWAGVSVALRAWSHVANDDRCAEASARLTLHIAERVLRATDEPSRYTDIISGDAGILLALLMDDSDTTTQAAHVLANRLAARGESGPNGLHWRMVARWPRLMPGFSHGTAGVAYALAAAGRTLLRRDLINVAVQGAEALLAVGDHPDGWAVPLTIPRQADRPAVFYGWCHGATGTVRLFLLLNEIDPQPRWQHAIDACLQALRDSRLPARLYPGYWDNLGRCCGTAGVGQLLLDRYEATGDLALLAWLDTLIADVLDRAVTTPHGITWSNTEHTATPPELPPEAGLMQGAAGIAGWLAHVHSPHVRPSPSAATTRRDPSWI
jgi:lantibiotic modifying enzyme